jgi:peptidoglycan/LPS O-acetylase OafA/YrhL
LSKLPPPEAHVRNADRFVVLDSFRGLCACAVALAHLNANSLFNYIPMLAQGHIYVDFFFVLSGFVIFQNYGERLREGYPVAKFMWLRFWRLYPLHLAMLALFIAAEVAQFWIRRDADPFSGGAEGVGGIVANLLLIQSLNTLPALSFNWPSWSISTEFWTYLVFGGILAVFPKRWPVVVTGVATGCLIALTQLRGDLYAMQDYGLLRCIYGFACGIGASVVFQRVRNSNFAHATALEWTALAAALLYISYGAYGTGSFLAPVVFTPIVVLFAMERGKASAFFVQPAFVAVGTLSYSIYMVHIFVAGKLFLLPALALHGHYDLTLIGMVDGKTALGSNIIGGTLLETIYLLVVIGISALTYRWIEGPCREWGRKHGLRPGTSRTAAKTRPSDPVPESR